MLDWAIVFLAVYLISKKQRNRVKIFLQKIILLIIIISIATSANEAIYDKRDTTRKSSIVYDKKTNKPITGTIIIHFENGDIWRSISYAGGKENGIEKWYFKNNILRYEITNKNGKWNGITKEYDKNGSLVSQTMYKDDEEIK
jgi:hypothetical protein